MERIQYYRGEATVDIIKNINMNLRGQIPDQGCYFFAGLLFWQRWIFMQILCKLLCVLLLPLYPQSICWWIDLNYLSTLILFYFIYITNATVWWIKQKSLKFYPFNCFRFQFWQKVAWQLEYTFFISRIHSKGWMGSVLWSSSGLVCYQNLIKIWKGCLTFCLTLVRTLL